MKVLELIEPLKITVFKIHEVNLMIKYLQFYNYDRTKHLPYSVEVCRLKTMMNLTNG